MTDGVADVAGSSVWVCHRDGPLLDGERAAVEMVGAAYGSGATVIAIPLARLGPGFLTLSTRIAGDVIQKFVNYGFQVAFVGDVSAAVAESDALRDFVRESNRGRHVWFLDNLDALSTRLGG